MLQRPLEYWSQHLLPWLQKRQIFFSPYRCVRQLDEEDCGAACIATVAECHGSSLPLGLIREAVGTTAHGTTLLGLRRGAENLGFHARAAKADAQLLHRLADVPLPMICHWQGNHWVVLHGQEGDLYVIADPAVGLVQLSEQELLRGWSDRVVLLLEPDAARFGQEKGQANLGLRVFKDLLIPFKPLLGQAVALNVVIGVLGLSMPLLMQVLTDDVLIRGDAGMLGSLSIGLILVFALRSALNLLQGHMVGYFGQKLQLQMILHYGQRLLGLPLNYFETHRSGEVMSRISDIRLLNRLLSDVVLGLPSQFCIAVVSILLMWTYNGWLTLAALGCYLLVLICNASFIPAQARLAKQLLVKGAENQGYLVELFRGISVVKCSEGTPQAWQEYQNNFGKLANASWTSLRLNLKQETVTTLLGSVTTVALLWYGSSFVISNQLSIGQLLAFSAMGANVFGFLAAISGISQEVLKADVVIKRMTDVLERKPEAAEHRGLHHVQLKPDVDIVCDQISFHHPGRRALLNQLSLRIPGGVTTALIGESGCGKSTLSKLIAGLQNPQHGSIHYGPYSASDLDMDCLRRQVVLVPQDSVMFNRTIFENFSFAHPGVSFEEVVQACQISLADDFIRELPEGYQTVIGEFGTNLSGGQRQRLAIARALIHNPPVLILDESTSALDPVLESRVVERLFEYRKGKTTLVISHRPSMILRADWVVVLEAGGVREQNTPHALRETFHLAPFLQAA